MTIAPESRTLARTTDPETSHEAARLPRKVDLIRLGILDVLSDGKARTLDQIVGEYTRRARSHGYPPAGASSIRTRTSELRKDERVERVEGHRTGRSNLGNPAGFYRALDVQNYETIGELS